MSTSSPDTPSAATAHARTPILCPTCGIDIQCSTLSDTAPRTTIRPLDPLRVTPRSLLKCVLNTTRDFFLPRQIWSHRSTNSAPGSATFFLRFAAWFCLLQFLANLTVLTGRWLYNALDPSTLTPSEWQTPLSTELLSPLFSESYTHQVRFEGEELLLGAAPLTLWMLTWPFYLMLLTKTRRQGSIGASDVAVATARSLTPVLAYPILQLTAGVLSLFSWPLNVALAFLESSFDRLAGPAQSNEVQVFTSSSWEIHDFDALIGFTYVLEQLVPLGSVIWICIWWYTTINSHWKAHAGRAIWSLGLGFATLIATLTFALTTPRFIDPALGWLNSLFN